MPHSLPALAFVLALQSLEVAGGAVYLREPVFLFPRDDGDGNDNDDGSSTTSHTTTSTTTSSTTSTSATSTSTSTSQSSSSSTTTTSATLTSFSSSYTSSPSSSQNNGSSTTNQGLSTGARTGLAFGIMCYLRKRSRRAIESIGYGPALLSSEVSQYRPPDSVASRERGLPPPPQLDTAHPNSPDISHSSSLSAISSAAPLLGDNSHLSSHPTSTLNRYSALSQASDPQRITMQDAPSLPNPYDPFSAAARSASYTSMASSPMHSVPHGASIPASAATMGTFATHVADSSSNIQPERRPSALHTDLTRHQKQLELDHRKRSLDAQEAQDPPPRYS
ncbi:hypothetical protein EV702DRAFT_1045291 [Suillus placidus]|uniref:Uncharacterized protein n=1 Tax=Suillus placidus TaxID=48579 RepID=A0A9P6ZVI8_9AGAM|nr:hypothetical protein EV702DRAFT_1045291 [Suillus placidus]